MAFLNWNTKYSVGTLTMDAEHQKWFSILNRLHDAMSQGKGKEAQQTILAEMMEYTQTHFSHEEALLKSKGYPDLAEHQKMHQGFTKQVQEMAAKVQSQRGVMTLDLLDFIKKFLESHILGVDSRYGAWLKAH